MADALTYDGKTKARNSFVTRTYGWMALALVISSAAALFTANCKPLLKLLFGNSFGFILCALLEVGLVIWLSASIRKISAAAAAAAFVAYSVINGITLSSVLWYYTSASIALVFIIAAMMFGGMAIFGSITKQRLDTAGRYMIMVLWGVVVASLVNMFLKSSGLDWILSMISVVLFTGLTAYDSQKIQRAGAQDDGSDVFKKASIIGALELYLDFINIFLSLLRLFGKRE